MRSPGGSENTATSSSPSSAAPRRRSNRPEPRSDARRRGSERHGESAAIRLRLLPTSAGPAVLAAPSQQPGCHQSLEHRRQEARAAPHCSAHNTNWKRGSLQVYPQSSQPSKAHRPPEDRPKGSGSNPSLSAARTRSGDGVPLEDRTAAIHKLPLFCGEVQFHAGLPLGSHWIIRRSGRSRRTAEPTAEGRGTAGVLLASAGCSTYCW